MLSGKWQSNPSMAGLQVRRRDNDNANNRTTHQGNKRRVRDSSWPVVAKTHAWERERESRTCATAQADPDDWIGNLRVISTNCHSKRFYSSVLELALPVLMASFFLTPHSRLLMGKGCNNFRQQTKEPRECMFFFFRYFLTLRVKGTSIRLHPFL